jgi:cytochrome c-type biogenesis protein CcmE
MKALFKITVCLLALTMSLGLKAQNDGNDMFVPIAKYLAQGNADNLSAWFADNLEISVVSSLTNSSKSQAKQILKSFFENYTPRTFDISHIAGRSNMKYALGTLNAGGETFNVTIFVSIKEGDCKIQQLKIERVQ